MARILVVLLFLIAGCAEAQQMVVLKKGHVLRRYYIGDEIRFVLKNDKKQKYHVVVASIQEFSFTTMTRDTIKFLDIAALKPTKNQGSIFKNKFTRSTLIGSAGLAALYFALKPAFGKKNPQSVNGLLYAAGIGAGSVLLSEVVSLIAGKGTMKLRGFKRLKFINYDSPLYQ